MALIGIYSDVHISKNSSILPLYTNEDDVYTTRLNMCKESMKWAYNIFRKNNVDIIINCGDTFNSHVISSDELSAYNDVILDILKEHLNEPVDITIVGNHDKFNNSFNSIDMLRLNNYSHLVNKYHYFSVPDGDSYCDCYALNFYDAKDFVDIVLEMINVYPKQYKKSILFMHGDINGSTLVGNKKIENHINIDFLNNYFDIIINGHIHCHETLYNKNNKLICNIGSLTSHSFADSNKHKPACYILNTETFEIEQICNPHAIIFKSYEIFNNDDITAMISDLTSNNNSYKIIVKIKCSFDMKDLIEKQLNSIKKIIKYKFIFTYDKKNKNVNNDNIDKNNVLNINEEFINFLSNREDLKGNINDYINIIF